MTVESYAVYRGELTCTATHGPSGYEIKTDAPVDNQGKGQAFSPTDLVAVALGACMLTTMGIVARRRDVDIAGAGVQVMKDMVADPFRRISALPTTITVPKPVMDSDRKVLEEAARTCPVMASLDDRILAPVLFQWLA